MILLIRLPTLHLESKANTYIASMSGRMGANSRAGKQRIAARLACADEVRAAGLVKIPMLPMKGNRWPKEGQLLCPIRVTITRISPGKLDTDNLASACKNVRDGIADACGTDDGHPMYEWRYDQRKPLIGRLMPQYGVEIRIEAI